MANVQISIGSDNLGAQFGDVLLQRKPRGKGSTLGNFAVAYGVCRCRFATLTVSAWFENARQYVSLRTLNRRSLEQPR
jgi:hypothetical protein